MFTNENPVTNVKPDLRRLTYFRKVAPVGSSTKLPFFTVDMLKLQSLATTEKSFSEAQPFKHQSHKMVKHTQTICPQIPDELFECA